MDALARRFERYRRHGDLTALGHVFDALAPRLLAVALHVCGNAADAEDVLQQTFLLAMEREVAFDPSRPLEPWLAGLLTNVARNARRHGERRRAEPLPDLVGDDSGPIAAAERTELVSVLRTHVEALPAEQRQVLRLQLQHGLSPTDIAEALELAPGTVRMRIHRGLQALRKLLPAGLGVFLGAAFAGRGLAAVKATVLRAGRLQVAAMGLTSATVIGGVLMMKKIAVLLGVVVLLTLSMLAWWSGAPADRSLASPSLADARSHTVADAVSHGTDDAASGMLAEDRTPAIVAVGSLRVRVTAVADAMVVPCMGVMLAVWPGDSPLVPFDGDVRRLVTDAVGEVLLAPLAPGPWQVKVVADQGAEPWPVTILGGGETLLPVQRSVHHFARGIVVDGDGAPVPHAEIWIHRGTYMGRYSTPEPGELETRCAALTGDDGRFVVPICDHESRLGACLAGYGESFAAFCDRDAGELRLVLGRTFAVASGTVHGPNGTPAAGALVQLRPAGQDTRRCANGSLLGPRVDRQMRTDANGRFRFDGVAPGTVRLSATAWPLNPVWRQLDLAAFSAVDVDLGLKEGVSVIGTVRYADGSPARTSMYSTPKLETDGHYSQCEVREDGSYELYYQPRRSFVVVVGRFGNIATSREFVDPASGVHRCDFVLDTMRSVPGRVTADSGPLANWNVVAASADGRRSWVRTDAEGNFRIGVVDGAVVALSAFAPDGAESKAAARWSGAVAPGQAVHLCVPAAAMPSASVRGRLLDAADRDGSLWRLRLHNADDQPRGEAIPVGPDGAFEVHGLYEGQYSLIGERETRSARRLATFDLASAQHVDLGDVVVESLSTVRVEFECLDGSNWRGPLPHAYLTDVAGRGVDAGTDRDAQSLRLQVVPGSYFVQVQGVDLIAAPQRIEVLAGVECRVRVPVGIGRSRKLVCNGDGVDEPGREPLHVLVRSAAGVTVVQQDLERPHPDLRGFCYWSFDCVLPFGSYHVEAHTDSGPRYRGSFEVRDNLDDPTRVDVPRAVQ